MASINSPVQEKRTIVEEGTILKGSLESSCPVMVRGRIEGDVQAPSMTVSATGTVEGKVRVAIIECDGQLAGEIDADRIELAGSVKSNTVIRATTIEMKLADKGGKKQIVFGNSAGADESTEPKGAEGPSEPSDAAAKGKRDASEAEGASKKDDTASERPASTPPKRRGNQSSPPGA